MGELSWLLDKLKAIIPLLTAIKKDKRDLFDSATVALAEAITETSIYFSFIKEGGEKDRE